MSVKIPEPHTWTVPESMVSRINRSRSDEAVALKPAPTEFKIVKARDPEDMQMKVDGHLAEGFKLHGDMHYSRELGLFVQALVREP